MPERGSGFRPGGQVFRGCLVAAGVGLLAMTIWVFAPAPGGAPPTPDPIPAMPRPNGLDDFVAAASMAGSGTCGQNLDRLIRSRHAAMPDWPRRFAEEKQLVEASAPIFARLRPGITKEASARPLRGIAETRPYLAGMRRLAWLEAYRMDCLRARGDHAGAVEAGLDVWQMANGVSRNDSAWPFVLAVAMREAVRARMVESVDHLSASDADRLGRRLDALLATQPDATAAIAAERNEALAMSVDMVETRLHRELTDPPLWKDRLAALFLPSYRGEAHLVRRRILLGQLDRYFRAWREQSMLPPAKRHAVAPPTNWVAVIAATDLGALVRRADLCAARDRMLRCQLAIQAYRARNGRVPDSLSQLGLDARVTTDPFTGNPLCYRPQGKDYLLWSVGPDGKDDGGAPMADEEQPGSTGDIGLWRLAVTRRPDFPGAQDPIPHMDWQSMGPPPS